MIKIIDSEKERYIEKINNIEHTVIVFITGEIWWTVDNKRHREDDNPAVKTPNGDKFWYKYNQLHRSKGLPAVISGKGQVFEWWINGLEHRGNGKPAYINKINNENSYYLEGKEVSEKSAIEYSLKNKLDKF